MLTIASHWKRLVMLRQPGSAKKNMRIVKEHRARAAEYDRLARHAFKDPELQKRYADLADDFDRMFALGAARKGAHYVQAVAAI